MSLKRLHAPRKTAWVAPRVFSADTDLNLLVESGGAAQTMTEYRDDPELTPEEKELTIRLARDEDRMHVHAEIAVAVKWLDNHPDFHETDRRESDGVVHSLTGTLPVGVLQLKGNPRKSNTTGRTLGTLPSGVDDDE